MKRCPTCQRAYVDDTLSFCLQDGTLLLSEGEAAPTVSFDPNAPPRERVSSHRSDAQTEVLPNSRSTPTERMPDTAQTVAQPQRPTTHDAHGEARPPKTQNTALVVGLTAIATLILVALAGVGAWLYLRDEKPTKPTPQPNQNDSSKLPDPKQKDATPNASPTAQVSPTPVDAEAVREQVTAALNGWTSASRARDLDKHMSFYADTLDTYYKASNVSSSRVRSDRSRAYTLYTTLDIELSDIKITPDPAGQRATATFDKTWTFEGDTKYSSGSVHQKVWLTKINGRWRITGEQDLKVYYVNNTRDL